MKAHWTREAINLVVPRVLANIINPDNIDALLTSQCTVAHATVTMDIKGQRDCERLFLWIMWTATVLACLAGFIIDKVIAIFSVFGGFLVLCALVRFARREVAWE